MIHFSRSLETSLKLISIKRKGHNVVKYINTFSKVITQEDKSEDADTKTSTVSKKTADSVMQTAVKKKQKLPFAKELFLGRFEQEILYFPEILEPKELNSLQKMVSPIENLFENVDSIKIDKEEKIPEDILTELKRLGVFGQQIPVEYDGLELNATELARVAEAIGSDMSIFTTLSAHQNMGLKGILLFGNDDQKAKYLPKLATGEHIAAFCLSETGSGSDMSLIQTRAVLSDDGKYYTLNGSKTWVCNGGIADIFTVFAKTESPDLGEENITAFIIERSFGGISHREPDKTLGIRGCNVCTVDFKNTKIPVENLLGKENSGVQMAVNILNQSHFTFGSSCAGLLKNLMNITVEHAINRTQFDKPLVEFDLIQEKFAKMACNIYAMESMAYFTAGIIDQDYVDYSVESAMVKIFSSEAAWYCVNECLQILGNLGCLSHTHFERAVRDMRVLSMFGGTNEILRMFISLSGLRYAGKELADIVRRSRNPLQFPGFVFKKTWEKKRQINDNPKLNLDLRSYLHPSFDNPANTLEYAVLRFQFCVEESLNAHGQMIMEKEIIMKRLADIAIDIYAMTACLSRSSRSYCIGLPNSIHERLIAHAFCYDAIKRIKLNVEEVLKGSHLTNDVNYQNIASTIFKNRGYCAAHPLSRMWN